ncbi:hypothetical protein [Xylanibacter rodentium]|uniref:Uncharacterized protein n=1 Tax=Xylanibacter rodentium TaxID=2736289 RepID=A0ABX2ATB6_9BACT|nr:hypothetical protein [Xylanibacter rodentium]NPE11788.1 hypothetical protein [Prevotella sp. PJ1A]NPE13729.1 hypothetical protein [Xylanibacter rodentium]NPE38911.1 hypothetical protein [Prevotella sp. PCJ2]
MTSILVYDEKKRTAEIRLIYDDTKNVEPMPVTRSTVRGSGNRPNVETSNAKAPRRYVDLCLPYTYTGIRHV